METLYKSKWLVFSFFRLIVDFLNNMVMRYDTYEPRISTLETQRLEQLRMTANLTDAVNGLSEKLENVMEIVASTSSAPTNVSASDLIKHPSLLMDKIKNDYEQRASKRTEGTE